MDTKGLFRAIGVSIGKSYIGDNTSERVIANIVVEIYGDNYKNQQAAIKLLREGYELGKSIDISVDLDLSMVDSDIEGL